jgi:hypothetical protein
MGQYYVAVNMDDMEHVAPHRYDNGAKLMEHSYVGNNFVEAVEFLLIDDGEQKGRWSGKRIVWAGDYADPEKDKADNLYSLVEGNGLQMLIEASPSNYPYLVNLDLEQYVDKTKCPRYGEDNDWQIHPLPLLTADGNGRGGGDYREDNDYVGAWSRNRIALMKEPPAGYTEITPNFIE